jgi:hypothetical protein
VDTGDNTEDDGGVEAYNNQEEHGEIPAWGRTKGLARDNRGIQGYAVVIFSSVTNKGRIHPPTAMKVGAFPFLLISSLSHSAFHHISSIN